MKEQSWIASECSSFWSPMSPLTNQTIAMCWEKNRKKNNENKKVKFYVFITYHRHWNTTKNQYNKDDDNDEITIEWVYQGAWLTTSQLYVLVVILSVCMTFHVQHKHYIKSNHFRRAPNRPTANRDYMPCKYLLTLPYYYCDTSIVL